MPTAIATTDPRVQALDRLAAHGRKNVQAALVEYRSLAEELSRDPAYEFDPATVAEILNTLKIQPADLMADAEALAALRDDESRVMTEAQFAESIARQKAAKDKAIAYRAEIPKLEGAVRYEDGLRIADMHLRGDIGRRKQANARLYGSPVEVQRRVDQGLPTGPKANVKDVDNFVADGTFGGLLR